MNENIKKVYREVAAIRDEARAKIADIRVYDRMEQARQGATAIDGKKFVFFQSDVVDLVHKAHDKALEAVDARLRAAEAELVAPPSDEAARYAATIATRDDMTEGEVAAALGRYHDHTTQKAILAAAARSNVWSFVGMTDAEQSVRDLNALRQEVVRDFTVTNLPNMSDAKLAFVDYAKNVLGERG